MTRTIAENLQKDCCSADPRIALGASWLIESARNWLSDCAWTNMEPEDFETLGTFQLVAGVDRFYDGGWAGFVRDQT